MPRNDRDARGYGLAHKKERERWKPAIARGEVQCARLDCVVSRERNGDRTIRPTDEWDLGHDDHDRTQYQGPEHRRCNRGAPSRRRRTPQPHTRRW